MDPSAVAQEVRALADLNLEEVRSEWRRRYGTPPKLRSADLLVRLLAWRIQAESLGGLDEDTRRALGRLSTPLANARLEPGMCLKREWRGVEESVEVLANGFRWRGQTYPSLSKVASVITGVKWNGPRFFGLNAREEGR